jgi:hypothetical protein
LLFVLSAIAGASGWEQQAKLTAGDGAANDEFGWSVAVDGNTAVVGAHYDDDKGSDSGSAYVFARSGSAWNLQAKLTANDGAGGDQFGNSVAVDGDTALIGAYHDDDNGADAGSAYIFTRSGNTWSQQAKLIAGDGAGGDFFGWSVALVGNTAVIGARLDDDNGFNSGSAYVFTRNGNTWSQQAKLIAGDGAGRDQFGWSVAVDGDTAVIGARQDDDNGSNSGSTYVFTRNGSAWGQQAKLTAADGAANDGFGWSVAIDDDTALIGARQDNDNGADSGSAYVFIRSGSAWNQQAKLTAADGAAGDQFADLVALAGDTAVIGARYDDDSGTDSGSAYIFTRSGSAWSQEAKLTANDSSAGDGFGISVAVDDNTVVIGARYDDDNGSNSGSAYIFALAPSFDDTVYFTVDDSGNVGGIDVDQNDIIAYDGVTGTFSVYFDGETVGLPATADINAFLFLNNNIVMSFSTPTSVPGIPPTIQDTDLVMYRANTNTFVWAFDGSDVGLINNTNDIDAIAGSPAGKLLLSVRQGGTVGPLTFSDTDLLQFNNVRWGPNTLGSFSSYFDGDAVGLDANSGDDINATWVDPITGEIYFSTIGNFTLPDLMGSDNDIVKCVPNTPPVTSCSSTLTIAGDDIGLSGIGIESLEIVPTNMQNRPHIDSLDEIDR